MQAKSHLDVKDTALKFSDPIVSHEAGVSEDLDWCDDKKSIIFVHNWSLIHDKSVTTVFAAYHEGQLKL
jgi:hypothetical protein